MTMVLRLNEDGLPASGEPVYLPAVERALYVIEGDVTVEFASGCINQPAGSAWLGGGEIALLPGPGGVRLLRWELAAGAIDQGALRSAPSTTSEVKLAAEIELERFIEVAPG